MLVSKRFEAIQDRGFFMDVMLVSLLANFGIYLGVPYAGRTERARSLSEINWDCSEKPCYTYK